MASGRALPAFLCLAREILRQDLHVEFAAREHREPPHAQRVPRILLERLLFAPQVFRLFLGTLADPALLALAREGLLLGLLLRAGQDAVADVRPDDVAEEPVWLVAAPLDVRGPLQPARLRLRSQGHLLQAWAIRPRLVGGVVITRLPEDVVHALGRHGIAAVRVRHRALAGGHDPRVRRLVALLLHAHGAPGDGSALEAGEGPLAPSLASVGLARPPLVVLVDAAEEVSDGLPARVLAVRLRHAVGDKLQHSVGGLAVGLPRLSQRPSEGLSPRGELSAWGIQPELPQRSLPVVRSSHAWSLAEGSGRERGSAWPSPRAQRASASPLREPKPSPFLFCLSPLLFSFPLLSSVRLSFHPCCRVVLPFRSSSQALVLLSLLLIFAFVSFPLFSPPLSSAFLPSAPLFAFLPRFFFSPRFSR